MIYMTKSLVKNEIRRSLALILAGLFAALALCGCSRRRNEGVPAETPAPSPTAVQTFEPSSGGTLRIAMPVNAPCSDPLDVTTEEMLYLFSLVYDSLLKVTPAGELEPSLCESWTGDGTGKWLLQLRSGVKWHDGSGELRAQDVISTYNALVSMEDSYYKPCLEHIRLMYAMDDRTVCAVMDIPGILGLYSLTFPIRRTTQLVGTGAYKLESMNDTTVNLKVNEDWWDKRPYIDRIVFTERDNNTTALASYEAGQLNIVPTDIITAGKYRVEGATNVYDVMTQNLEALLFNHTRPLFSDGRMRLAVAHGINRSPIITNVYSNKARAADVPIAPDNWLYDSRSAVLNYDPETAARLIDEAGYTVVSHSEDGLRYSRAGGSLAVRLLTSATTENTIRSDAANMIASQLKELGFRVEVVTKVHAMGDPESEFITALKEGDWDMALVGFNMGMDCELSQFIDSGGANNFGRINDPALSELAARMTNVHTEEELREAAYLLQSGFVEKAPFLPLYFRLNSVICSAELCGIEGAREPMLFADEKNWFFANG